jgi:FixJ family two-component response regulator
MSMISNPATHEIGAAFQYPAGSWEKRAGTGATFSRSLNMQDPVVFVIDDDVSIREALRSLFHSVRLRAEAFGSAAEWLASKLPDSPGCLVLENRLPGMSGLEFQAQLARANIHIPIIFMTGYGDIPMTVQAMKAGAVDFLTKPFRDQDMLDAVAIAIARDRMRRDHEKRATEMRGLFETLKPREREVMALVTSGLMNKQVAGRTGLAETTVKIHRGRVMRKIGAKSLADLVRMAEILGLHRNSSRHRLQTGSVFPLLVNDHERPSPDGATQGSSVWSAAT